MPPIAEAVLQDANALLTLAAVLASGVSLGALASRLRLPQVTGQILAGVAIGSGGLRLFDDAAVAELEPLKEFALGLMGVTVGAHLNVRRLRNAGKRLFLLLVCEATVTPLFVLGALYFLPEVDLPTALLLAALSVSTAPATIVAIVKEARARGVFVKTLIAAVAINNMVCILLFEACRAFARAHFGADADVGFAESLQTPAYQIAGALVLGGVVGMAMHTVSERALRPDWISTAATISLLLTYGAARYLGFSPLLACLFLGMVQTNATPARDKVLDTVFAHFEPAILAVFFTLAGMHLSFEHIASAGTVALAFFGARVFGKLGSAALAMRLAGATSKVRRYLGLALLPQAGLAIGLVLLVEDDPSFAAHEQMVDLFLAVVLTAVTLNEIVGPILTRLGLSRSGEVGKDRTRLIDFLQEENIVTDLDGGTKREVIERMVDLLISSHHLRGFDRDAFLESVLVREAQVSTCLGGGLFVPHGTLPEGTRGMLGAMGISRRGLDLTTPDARRVHCVVLLATPPEERLRHLEVLAALARTVGRDPAIQQQLFGALSSAHAYEILHGEEAEDFNYFFEDD